jgi:hypothetical protein
VSTLSLAKSRNPKSAAPKKGRAKSNATSRRERVLTLLSQPEGASIEEMMLATDWQQHSVRGFLAAKMTIMNSQPVRGLRSYFDAVAASAVAVLG